MQTPKKALSRGKLYKINPDKPLNKETNSKNKSQKSDSKVVPTHYLKC